MSEKQTIAIDQLLSIARLPEGGFTLTVRQGEQQIDLNFPASQAANLVLAAFAGMPQPEMTPGKEMTTHGFEVSGLATGRDTLGRLGLTIAVSGNAVTFVVPPEHEATLRAAVVETAPPPPGEKPN
jgi:hypothetical protein